MAGHSISPGGKIGSSGKHYAQWVCEMGDQNKRLFRGKHAGRESLVICIKIRISRDRIIRKTDASRRVR